MNTHQEVNKFVTELVILLPGSNELMSATVTWEKYRPILAMIASSGTTLPIFFVMLISLRFAAALGTNDHPFVVNGTAKTRLS